MNPLEEYLRKLVNDYHEPFNGDWQIFIETEDGGAESVTFTTTDIKSLLDKVAE